MRDKSLVWIDLKARTNASKKKLCPCVCVCVCVIIIIIIIVSASQCKSSIVVCIFTSSAIAWLSKEKKQKKIKKRKKRHTPPFNLSTLKQVTPQSTLVAFDNTNHDENNNNNNNKNNNR